MNKRASFAFLLAIALIFGGVLTRAFAISTLNFTNGVINSGGNVGIGTTTPGYPLHVVSNSSAGNSPVITIENTSGANVGSFGPGLIFKNDIATTHGYIIQQYQNSALPYLSIDNQSNPFQTYFTIDQSGNIGIATNSPAYLLDVNGTGRFTQPVVVGTPTLSTQAATKGYVDAAIGAGGAWTSGSGAIYYTGGNVGIGTSDPSLGGSVSSKFTVQTSDNSTAMAFGGSSGYRRFAINPLSNGGWTMYDGTNASGTAWSAGITQLAGNVGINNAAPTSRLGVITANETAPTSISAYDTRYAAFGPGAQDAVAISKTSAGSGYIDSLRPGVAWDPLTLQASQFDFRLSGGGTPTLDLNSSGNVGIGTASPSQKLEVAGALSLTTNPSVTGTTGSTFLWNQAGVGPSIAGANFEVFTNGTNATLFANTSGYVGIDQTGPSYNLDVNGTGRFTQPVVVGTPTLSTQAATKGYVDAAVGAGGAWTAGSGLIYYTGGNVGIGTTNPNVKFDVGPMGGSQTTNSGAGGLIRNNAAADTTPFTQARIIVYGGTGVDTTNWAYFGYGSDASLREVYAKTATPSGGTAYWGTSSAMDGTGTFTPTMALTASGRLGIGVTSPAQLLDVTAGSGTSGYIRVAGGSGGTQGGIYLGNVTGNYGSLIFDNSTNNLLLYQQYSSGNLLLGTNNTTNMTIQSGGNVGIGTTSPGYLLDVNGTAHAATAMVVGSYTGSGGSTNPLRVIGATGSGNSVNDGAYFGDGSTAQVAIGVNTGAARTWIQSRNYSSGPVSLTLNPMGGDVLIGTSTASQSLYVYRTGVFTPDGNTRVIIQGSGGGQAISEYYNTETNPRWAIGRDAVTGGVAGLDLGDTVNTFAAGGSAVGIPSSRVLAFYTSNGTALTERMRIDGNGNVGIGATPSYQLDVNGEPRLGVSVSPTAPLATNILSSAVALVGGYGGNYLSIGQDPTSHGQWIQSSYQVPNTAIYPLELQPLGGSVGIGNTSPSYKLDVVSGGSNTARFGTSASDVITIGNGAGKVTAGTFDPAYSIDGKGYATYLPGITGEKEETADTISLVKVGKGYQATLDFANAATSSDLWLWRKVIDPSNNFAYVSITLSPSFNGNTWYTKDSAANQIVIHGSAAGEVSYQLIGNRFDWQKWGNTTQDEGGLVVPN